MSLSHLTYPFPLELKCANYSISISTQYHYHKGNVTYKPTPQPQSYQQQRSTMTALERSLTEAFPNILELPSGLKLHVSLTPPGPVTEMDEERGVAALPGKRLAICLHPWARLGGNMDDPCVCLEPISL